jgi:hypothetical protein
MESIRFSIMPYATLLQSDYQTSNIFHYLFNLSAAGVPSIIIVIKQKFY